MFIPAWILVAVAVVCLIIFSRVLGTILFVLALATATAIFFASLFFGIYFFYRQEYALALVVASPLLALALIGALDVKDEEGRLKVGTLKTHLGLHRIRAGMLSNPAAIVKLRVDFARRVGLSEALLRFCEDVKGLSRFYEDVKGLSIERTKRKNLQPFGIDPTTLPDHDALIYRFSCRQKSYAFCAYDDAVPTWPFSAFKAFVVEIPTKILLEDQIVFRRAGNIDEYDHDHIEAFRPGEWLVTLLKVADTVRADSEAKVRAASRHVEAARAKKFL